MIEDESGQPAPGVAVRFTDGSTLVANPDGVVIHNTKASDVVVAPQKLVQGEDPAGTFEPRGDIASKGDYLTFTMRPLEAKGRSTLELTFNPVVFDDPNVLNPFASQRIREAIHYLVNRDYIADEHISGHATPCLTFISEDTFDYEFMADIIAELADKYAFNQALAEAIITEEMEALGAELVEGVWHYNGEPVTLKFIIREEDERKAIGEYIAGQLEAIGFTVQRLEKNGSEANPIWMIGDPHAGEWHLYTGGWTGSVGMAFSDTFLFQYFTTDGVSYSPLWQSYDPPEELASAAVQLWGENFRSAEERKEVFEQGLKSALEYAVRIGLVTKWLE
ncbi:MAG: ABC transporter substrate-binding protein [Limnochordia bacterium]